MYLQIAVHKRIFAPFHQIANNRPLKTVKSTTVAPFRAIQNDQDLICFST